MQDWELTESFTSSSGIVRWARFGDVDREAVVLLHGTPFSSFVWRTIAPALGRHLASYVWDMPGYGASEMFDDQDVSIERQAIVLTELLAHWGLTAPAVVAHDIGGAIALRAHLLHDIPYRKLALVDPVALAPWGSPFFRLVREHADVFARLPANLHAALVREYVSSASHRGLHPATLDRLVEPWTGDRGQPAFYRQIAQANQRATDEIEPLYGRVDLPVLICWGVDDAWIPAARGQELAQRFRSGPTLHLLPDAGHLVQEDAPAALATALLAFLLDLDP